MDYALLSYGFPDLPNISNTGNIIQSVAAAQFLPKIDALVPMLEMDKYIPKHETKMIMNGFWFEHYFAENCPAYLSDQILHSWDNIVPLLISMHFDGLNSSNHLPAVREETKQLFIKNGPVGTRDAAGAAFLHNNGIEAYKSLCLTLTLKRRAGIANNNRLLLVDLSDKLAKKLKAQSDDEAIDITHLLKHYWAEKESKGIEEIAVAEYLLDMIQGARMVVTSRLHIALPSLALGTPVVFVPDTGENGKMCGDIRKNTRLSDYMTLLNTMSSKAIMRNQVRIDVNNPVKNSDKYLVYRDALVEKVNEFIGNECPYNEEEYRCSVYEKMTEINKDDVINMSNHMVTQMAVIHNRYRDAFLKKIMVRCGTSLGILREPSRFYLKGDK